MYFYKEGNVWKTAGNVVLSESFIPSGTCMLEIHNATNISVRSISHNIYIFKDVDVREICKLNGEAYANMAEFKAAVSDFFVDASLLGGQDKENVGVAAELDTLILGGVIAAGDTLKKLYDLIISAYSEVTVATIAERDLYEITKLPTTIFVLDDGDSHWALYKATTTGIGATYVKLSDPDLLNAVMTANAIREALGITTLSGSNTGDQTLQQAYNISTTPRVTTSLTNGPFQIKRGSSSDSDIIWEVLNGVGSIVASFDGNGNLIAATTRFGTAINNTTIESDGTIKFNGEATTFDDLLPSSVTIGTGGSAPSFTAYNGNLRAYEFVGSGATTKELNMGFQLPHSYKEGSDIVPHIHLYIPNDGNARVIKFSCEYTWTNVDSVGAVTTTTVFGTVSRAANQGISNNTILSLGTISGVGKTISSTFMCRIFRDPTDAADTFTPSVWLKGADIHFEKDTIGSRTIAAK